MWHAGNRILTLGEVPKDQVYGVKLKGVSVCFTMLKAVLSGNYVNFGVFRLYGDDALDNALQTFIKLLLSIPHSDLLVRLTSDCGTLCDGGRRSVHVLSSTVGLPQAQPVLLLPAGSADTGPHELHRQPGAASRDVHPVVHIRRVDRAW